MNISPDGVTVRFETAPEELFEAEKSGAKPNTTRILDIPEADKIKCSPPKKIIIQYQHEIFQRALTHICIAGSALGKVIVIFSWANLEHHHTIHNETGHDPKAHTMSLDEEAKPYIDEEMSRELKVTLNNLRGELPLNELIRKMLDCYLAPSHKYTMPPTDDAFTTVTVSRNLHRLLQSIAHGCSLNSVIQELYEASQYQQFEAETAPATEEAEEDKKLALIGISKGLSNILVRLAYNRSMDAVIRELYQVYLDKRAEERGPLHD